tara:strand:- start:30 stop:167 length:138 start_codon:yes stop_codon:yes gene_type:complete
MNTTLRYWSPIDQRCRYISFQKYTDALNMVKVYNKLGGKAEVIIK